MTPVKIAINVADNQPGSQAIGARSTLATIPAN